MRFLAIKNSVFLVGVTLFICVSFPSLAAETEDCSWNKYQLETRPYKKSYIVPLIRLTILDATMYGGLAIAWPNSFSPKVGSVKRFKKNWKTPPEYYNTAGLFASDGDPWYFNVILHTLYGSEVYISARVWGHSPLVSFVFGALSSFTWEYLIEGWFTRSSAIDLFWTPMAGVLFGELRYQLLILAVKRIRSYTARTIVMGMLDPLGQIERAIL